MKKLVITLLLIMAGISVSANSIRFFTYSQVSRTVSYLNAQPELMIYCGYPDEIETYVIVSDVWAEKINSKYYEVWLYGFDAYTGDEIYMPIDLGCIWLQRGMHMFNAAEYLRFHTSAVRPAFTWYMPKYNPFPRYPHPHGMARSYHYEIHLHGWHYTVYDPYAPHPLPPYYCRHPFDPAPIPMGPWTPGPGPDHRPQVIVNGHSYIGGARQGSVNATGLTVNTRQANVNVSNTSTNGRSTVNVNTGANNGRNAATTNAPTNTGRGTATTNTPTSNSRGTATTNPASSSSNGRSATTQTNTGSTTGRSGSSAQPSSTSSTPRASGTTNSSSTNVRSATTQTGSSSNGRSATTQTGSSSNGRSSATQTGSSNGRSSKPAKTSSTTNGRGTTSSSTAPKTNGRGTQSNTNSTVTR